MNRRFWPVMGFLCIMMTVPAYAGDINGNEQEIVGVVHSQFEKDGVIYRVKQEYIDSAMSYLRQDDVDLMPADVQMVIGEIYANVQTGVESGYLEEVGRTGAGTPEGGAAAGTGTDKQAETGGGKNSEHSGSSGGNSSEAGSTGGGADSEAGNASGDGTDPEAGSTSGDGTGAEAGNASGGGTNPEEPAEPEPVAQAISILELMDSMPGQNYDYIAGDTDRLMRQINLPYQTMWMVIVCLAILLAGTGFLCLWEKCFADRHHMGLRSILKLAMGAELFCQILAVEVLLGIGIGAFQDSAVLNRLNQTEYYRTIYEDLRHDTRISFALMDIPYQVMDESITYERVVMAARQQVESTLHKGSYQANTAILTERLEKDIRSYLEESSIALTGKAETGLDLLIDRLDEKYTHLLQWPFAPWWVQLADRFALFVKKAGAALAAMAVAVQLLLFWMHHYRHRAIRSCGRGILAASAAALLLGAVPYVGQLIPERQMKPEYMGQFFYVYERGILLAVMMIGAAGILVGIGYLLMARSWKEGKQQQ